MKSMSRELILMDIIGVSKKFNRTVLDDINLTIYKGSTIGIVGMSGSGKTTLAKIMVGLISCDSGKLIYNGRDISNLRGKDRTILRPDLQMVFQDYLQALPPLRRVGSILSEALIVNGLIERKEVEEFVLSKLDECRLPKNIYKKYPSQLSGGEAQRVALIRSLLVKPKLLILDEVTSGLDEETADRIMMLPKEHLIADESAVILISHDLTLINRHCDIVLNLDTA